MKIIEKPLDKLIMYSHNNKVHTETQIHLIANSIAEFGWLQPIVIDENNIIIAGHGRYLAGLKLGKVNAPCVLAENLTPAQIRKYRLLDNKLSSIAEYDIENIKIELEDLQDIELNELFSDILLDSLDSDIEKKNLGALEDRFIIPPFSILDTRQGHWQERKKHRKELIGDNGESREDTLFDTKNSKTVTNTMVGASLLDPVLAEISNIWFGVDGGNTFDCFAGDSVFGYVSGKLGHNFTGIELRKEQADLNIERIKEFAGSKYICDDGQNVLKHIKEDSQDLLFSCPPYFDLEVYSKLDNDASNQKDYKDFIKILENSFLDAIKCLKQNRFAVIVVGDIRDKQGFYYDFIGDIKSIFSKGSMKLYNELILIEMLGTQPQRVARSMYNRKVGKCHQNVLVFYKGNPKDIQKHFKKLDFSQLENNDESEDI